MVLMLIHMIPAALIAFIVHLIMHEVGHLIGGLLAGWKLINLQVYRFSFIKEGGRFRFQFLPATDYQCIMYPESINSGALLYTSGGYWMNLFLAFDAAFAMLFFINNMVAWTYAWCFFGIGIVFYLFNGVPNTQRICNDKACYILLKDSRSTYECHNSQLIVAKYLNLGLTYQRIGKELICLTGDRVYNDILAYQAVLEYYYYLETKDYEMMRKSLDKIFSDDHVSRKVKNIICLERLYSDLVLWFEGTSTDLIKSSKYGHNLKQYINNHGVKGDVHTARVRAAYIIYDYYVNHSFERAVEEIDLAINKVNSLKCLYEGEKIFCINQLRHIKDCCLRTEKKRKILPQ